MGASVARFFARRIIDNIRLSAIQVCTRLPTIHVVPSVPRLPFIVTPCQGHRRECECVHQHYCHHVASATELQLPK